MGGGGICLTYPGHTNLGLGQIVSVLCVYFLLHGKRWVVVVSAEPIQAILTLALARLYVYYVCIMWAFSPPGWRMGVEVVPA